MKCRTVGRQAATLPMITLSIVWLTAFAPENGAAQVFAIDGTFERAFAPEPMPSPLGFDVTVGGTSLLGPLGAHVGLRTLYERGEKGMPQSCGFAGCTPGPFDQSYTMRMLYAGVSYEVQNPVDVYLTLSFDVGTATQIERLEHMDGGEDLEDRSGAQRSLGGGLDLRLRPAIGPLRPMFSARFDRLFEGSCPADGSCFPNRSVWSLSAGLSWVSPLQ